MRGDVKTAVYAQIEERQGEVLPLAVRTVSGAGSNLLRSALELNW